MAILDFTEIPTASPAQRNKRRANEECGREDLDAFEKFAEEFFEKIEGCEIVKRVARGADLGADLIVKRGSDKILVSCKHYAESDNAVGPDKENITLLAVLAHECNKFIGFYSTIPTNSLQAMFEAAARNPKFDFEIEFYKSSDIESKLLDKDNATGWLLAARYFPKSFANLFRKFVVPISHYTVADVKEESPGAFVLEGPYGKRAAGAVTKAEIVDEANDELTNAVHIGFFREALKEAIDIFPKHFTRIESTDPAAVKLDDIAPAWDEPLVGDAHPPGEACNLPILVCSLWSFWDHGRALQRYLAHSGKDKLFKSPPENQNAVIALAYLQASQSAILSVGSVLGFCSGRYRDIFARLFAFAPAYRLKNSEHAGPRIPFYIEGGVPLSWAFEPNTGLEFIMGKLLK